MGPLPKPLLRDHLLRTTYRHAFGAFAFVSMNCGIFYFTVMRRRKLAYAEYHRKYNLDNHMDDLIKYGLLQSAKKS